MNLYFTHESRDTLKSFTLFITFKTITRLNLEQSDNFEIEFKRLADVVHVLQTTQNSAISHCVLQMTVKKYNARAQLLFRSLNLLFSDVPVAVVAMVYFNSYR